MSLTKATVPRKISLSAGSSKITDTVFSGLGDRYFEKLKRCRDKILQVDASNGITETAGSILDKSILIAMALLKRQVREGDRIVVSSRLILELTPTLLGIWYIGAIVCSIDSNIDIDECTAFLQRLQPKIAFVDMRAQGYIEMALKGSNITNCEIIVYGRSTVHVAGTDKIFSAKRDDSFLPVKLLKAKLKSAIIIPSEGTSRESRLVDISHYAMFSRYMSFDNRVGKKIDKVLSFYAFDTFPNLITTCSALEDGIVKIIPGPFSAKYACRLIHDLKVDLAILGTDIALKLSQYIKSTKDFDLSCLKGIVAGLMATTASDMAKIQASFPNAMVINVYGCMECGYISGGAAPLTAETLPKPLTLLTNRLGSIGRVFANVKYKVIDLNSGEIVLPDNWGEMYVGGPCLMTGYYGDQQRTAMAFENNFYKTGDVVQYDEEEFLYLRGRIFEQLLIDGFSYPASDLEEIVQMHPNVREVAVVFEPVGITAYVVLHEKKNKVKEEDIIDFVADYTPEFQRIAAVHFVQILPKTIFGRVQKYKLHSSRLLEASKSSLTMITTVDDTESKPNA